MRLMNTLSLKRIVVSVLRFIGVKRFKPNYDLAGYEIIIDFLDKYLDSGVIGNVLEIGAFMGGGTQKLGKWAEKHNKRIYVIDIFKVDSDNTQTLKGETMRDLYKKSLNGRELYSIFLQNTKNLNNLIVFRSDSKNTTLDPKLQFCFAFIDGNHSYEYVLNDFNLAWQLISNGGWVGLHDYDHDLQSVTRAIDEILVSYSSQIIEVKRVEMNWMIFIQKGEKVHND